MSDTIVKCVCQHCQRVTVVPQETIRTALSEADQRVKDARREALEEAAILAGSVGDEQIRSGSLDLDASVDKIIVAIRALIPSEPHDAEGRE